MTAGTGTGYQAVTAAAGGELVTLAEAKEAIRIASTSVDPQVQILIESAEEWVANQCRVKFNVTSLIEYHDGGGWLLCPYVWPIVAVSAVYDMHAAATFVTTTDYRKALNNRSISRLSGNYPFKWESGHERLRLTYTAGFNNGDVSPATDSVAAPKGMKAVVLALIRRAFEVRGGQFNQSGQGFTIGWDRLAGGEIQEMLQFYREGVI